MISNYKYENIPNQINLMVPMATPEPLVVIPKEPNHAEVEIKKSTKPKKPPRRPVKSKRCVYMKCWFYIIMLILIIKFVHFN